MENNNNNNNLDEEEDIDIEEDEQRRMSINQAKRLLALASIRPSKTFHKTMTQEEIQVLRKYYDIIKPKVMMSNNAQTQQQQQHLNQLSELEKEYASQAPIIYDTTKVNLLSLHNLKNFIETYKKDIESGMYVIDYDSLSDPKGFVLKPTINNGNTDSTNNNSNLSTIKFPNELNDTFFALAVVTGNSSGSQSSSSPIGSASLSSINAVDKESSVRLGEANLFRIVNWNDTTMTNTNIKTRKSSNVNINVNNNLFSTSTVSSSSSSNQLNVNNNNISPTSSTLSFEYIKSLSSLVNSILEPKLLTKLSYTGVDIR